MKYSHRMVASREGTSTLKDDPVGGCTVWGNVANRPSRVDVRNYLSAGKGFHHFSWGATLLSIGDTLSPYFPTTGGTDKFSNYDLVFTHNDIEQGFIIFEVKRPRLLPFLGLAYKPKNNPVNLMETDKPDYTGSTQSWLQGTLGNEALGEPHVLQLEVISDPSSSKMMHYYPLGSAGYGQEHTGYGGFHRFVSRNTPLTSSVKVKKANTLEDVSKSFVDKIQSIETVREVLLVEGEEEATIWTVISATPFEDKIRRPIYEAQLEVLQTVDQPLVDFRLVNIDEFPSATRDQVLPREAKTLWKR